MSDIDDRLDQLESQLQQQQATIEEQQEIIEEQRERIAELEGDPDGGEREEVEPLPTMSRRGALTVGGALGLLFGGVGTATANPQGQVGTSQYPLSELYTEELNGGVTGGTQLTNLVGEGLTLDSGTLTATYVQESEPPVGNTGTFWAQTSSFASIGETSLPANAYSSAVGDVSGTQYLYVGDGGGNVTKIDPNNMTTDSTLDLTNPIRSLAFGGDGLLYACDGGGTVSKIDPSGMSREKTYDADSTTYALAYGNGSLYAGDDAGKVYEIDPSDMSLSSSNNPKNNTLHSLEYGADGGLYGGDNGGNVFEIGTGDLASVNTFSGSDAFASLAYRSGNLYALDATSVYKFDPSDMSRLASITPYSIVPKALTDGSDGYLYVAGQYGDVLKIDPTGFMSVKKQTATSDVGPLTYASITDGDDGFVYAGVGANAHKIPDDPSFFVSTGSAWFEIA
jgi:hypothetical protein